MPKRLHPEKASTKQGGNKSTKLDGNDGTSLEPAEKRRKKQQQKKGTPAKTLRKETKSKNIEEEEEEILVDVERVEDEEEDKEKDGLEMAEIPGKSRREKEKNAFITLANLLPLSPAIRDQLDKSGILRISIAFLQLHQLISGLMGRNDGNGKEIANGDKAKTKSEHKEARRIQREWAIGREGTMEPLKQFAFNLFQAMDGFLIVLNQEGQVVYVNETVAVHLGLSQIELIGNSLADFLHPADVQLLREKLALFVDSRELRIIVPEFRFVLRFRCAPGRRPMMSTTSSGLRGAPGFKPIHFMGTLWPDAPGRFIAFGQPLVAYGQNELRLSPSMFMFRSTPSLELIFICKRFTSISGFQPNALLDHSLYSFVHPADTEFLIEMHQTALDQGQAQSAFFRMIGARGGYFWVQCRICLINSNGHSCISQGQILVGICTMISEMEYENEIMDSAQKEILMASKDEDSGKMKGKEDEEEDEGEDDGDGLLGYYSRKLYQQNNQPNANDGTPAGSKNSKAK